MENVKPGWQTTEFWMALIGMFLGMGVLLKVLTQDEATAWQELFTAFLPVILPTVYIVGRAKIKSAAG